MDNVADMFAMLVNAQKVGRQRVVIPYSEFKEELIKFLQEQGVVAKHRFQEGSKSKIIVSLLYEGKNPKIMSIKRISRSGERHYVSAAKLPYTGGHPGFVIVSTSEGLLKAEQARKKKIGGELVGEIYLS